MLCPQLVVGGGGLSFEENNQNISEVCGEESGLISVNTYIFFIFLPCQIILAECAVHSADTIVNPTDSPLKANFLSQ